MKPKGVRVIPKVWYVYKNGYSINQTTSPMLAREYIKREAGVVNTPIDMEFTDTYIRWVEVLTKTVYEAKLEEIKR